MARFGAVLDERWSVGDHDHRVDEPGTKGVSGFAWFAAGAPGSQRELHFTAQTTACFRYRAW